MNSARRGPAKLKALVILICGLAALTGCSPARTEFSLADQSSASVAGYTGIRSWGDDPPAVYMNDGMLPKPRPDATVRILALSGGGSGGAFAAGILSAWTTMGNRPKFDLVTGVSTGALIAPFAFLGSRFDPQLVHLYTSGIAASIVKRKTLVSGLLGSGLLEQQPLRDIVASYANEALLAEIAAEHRAGRRLFVVTTNLDAQRPVIWNMGAIAASGKPGALKLFQDVLLASASIPAAFPPVLIKVEDGGKSFEEMHSDGASSTQIFAVPESLLSAERKSLTRKPARAELYIIINNALMPEFSVTADSTLAVGIRALATAIKSHTRASIAALYAFARREHVGFKVATIDETVPYEATDPFNTDYMRSVFEIGYFRTIAGKVWQSTPSYPADTRALHGLTSNDGSAGEQPLPGRESVRNSQ